MYARGARAWTKSDEKRLLLFGSGEILSKIYGPKRNEEAGKYVDGGDPRYEETVGTV